MSKKTKELKSENFPPRRRAEDRRQISFGTASRSAVEVFLDMKNLLRNISLVQSIVEYEQERNQTIRFQSAKGESLHALACFPLWLVSYPVLNKIRIGFYFTSNRVATGDRVRRAAGEGMARVERQPSPLNRCPLVATMANSDRCNSAPREQGSVGNGNHCARLFQMRSDRPMRLCQKQTTSLVWGWFVLASSLNGSYQKHFLLKSFNLSYST